MNIYSSVLQLVNPASVKPPLKFGTIPWTYTENALRQHYPIMYDHMKAYQLDSVQEGISKVKLG